MCRWSEFHFPTASVWCGCEHEYWCSLHHKPLPRVDCGVFPYLLQINGAGRRHRVSVLREHGDVRRAVVLGRVVHRAVLRGVRARRLVRDVGAHGGRPVRAGQPRHHLEVLLITAADSSSITLD